MDALERLQINLEKLNDSATAPERADREIRQFYHCVLIKCAAQMSVEDFARAVEAANGRYPVGVHQPGEPEPATERDRR